MIFDKLREKFIGEADPEERILDNLHPDFKIKDGPWRFNREPGPLRGFIVMKIRFGFDNASLLDGCPFVAKITINSDEAIRAGNIGLMYGTEKDKDALIEWAKKFPYSELIEGLDYEGVSTPDSKVSVLKK